METNNEIGNPLEVTTATRPKLLNVICIISFVWCGLSFVMGIYGLIQNQPEKMAEQIEQLREVMPQMADQMEQNMIEMQENTYMQISPYLNFVYILLSFLGVMMMWKMNKKGFYIYVVGELLPYIGFIVAAKPMMAAMSAGGMMKGLGVIMLVLMIIFDLAFFIMYGSNLKHMKN